MMRQTVLASVVACGVVTGAVGLLAQAPAGQLPAGQAGGRGAAQAPQTARTIAPFDPSGYWVSIVSEDWRWRMVTPQKGDYASVPLNAVGRKVADAWDLQKDKANGEECKAFGAAAIMRLPVRAHITWQDDNTLKIDLDAGQQTRLLHFGAGPTENAAAAAVPAAERTWQGISVAEWFKQPQIAGFGGGGSGGPRSVAGGNLKVVTRRMRAGYLRKNGVPYSDDAVLTEYYNRHAEPNGDEWLTVTSVVDDPKYLQQPFITSSSFKKEPDGSKWRSTPCEVDPPRE